MLCTFSAEKQEFSSIITLGKNVCGHPTIVHGGLTASIVDETFGGLTYMLKKRGVLGPGPAFTVHMVMDWKKVNVSGMLSFAIISLIAAATTTERALACSQFLQVHISFAQLLWTL